MHYRRLAAVVMILATPATGWGQNVTWQLPRSSTIEVEAIRAQSVGSPGQPNPTSDIFIQGATFLRLRTPEYGTAHVVVEVPAAILIGRVPSCVDAYCTSFEKALVLGNPLLGVSYHVPGLPLAIEVAYRFPIMDLEPWESGADNWQSGIDQMAADAALIAVATDAEDAITPHTSSLTTMLSGEVDLPSRAWGQLNVGAARVSQRANESYHRWYEQNSRTDIRYDVRLGFDAGRWRSGAGLSGQSTVARSPSADCEMVFGTQCDSLAQVEVMSSYAVGRWSPSLLVRWPLTEYLKRQTSWSIGLGLAVRL